MKTRLILLAVLAPVLLAIVAAVEPDKGFVVHEWGTFTSVQGADGVQMVWNPFVAPELPKFVYDSTHPGGAKRIPGIVIAGKIGTAQRQRMETPVIYFYSDAARTVDVTVKFPEGRVTEWYPQHSALDLSFFPQMSATRPALHWEKVEVLPPAASANTALPVDPSGSHYYAARETDASVLRVPVAGEKTEVEKFLFYRGVAGFQAPLSVKLESVDQRRLTLTNTGAEELRSLFIYEVRAGGGTWAPMESLKPGETRTLRLDEAIGNGQLTTLAGALSAALVREGLYAREAAAMVKTWESSWFAEPGMRVLYTLPRAWTDRTLPLAIAPAPRATERVMVARAEIITPEMEGKLLSQVEQYVSADPASRAQIVAETRALGLGRFTEPAMRRVLDAGPRSQDFATRAWELFLAANVRPAPAAATIAAE